MVGCVAVAGQLRQSLNGLAQVVAKLLAGELRMQAGDVVRLMLGSRLVLVTGIWVL